MTHTGPSWEQAREAPREGQEGAQSAALRASPTSVDQARCSLPPCAGPFWKPSECCGPLSARDKCPACPWLVWPVDFLASGPQVDPWREERGTRRGSYLSQAPAQPRSAQLPGWPSCDSRRRRRAQSPWQGQPGSRRTSHGTPGDTLRPAVDEQAPPLASLIECD